MSDAEPIYLDYAATTPTDPRVVEAMLGFLGPATAFANPSSGHAPGRRARAAVEAARVEVAALIHAQPDEILWTSGATEAINLALQGTARGPGAHVVTCATEHAATLDTCAYLAGTGVAVTVLDPDPGGHLDVARVAAALRPETVLVSLMHVNNETGVIHDLAAIGAATRAAGVRLHVDAAQSAGRLAIDVAAMQIDLMSLNAHKLCGPKGIGALYVRQAGGKPLPPLVHGGGQEWGVRPGTLPTHQIVGMGTACRLVAEARDTDVAHARALRERLLERLQALPGFALTGAAPCVPGIVNLRFDGLSADRLMAELPGIACSSGAACATGSAAPSHVLTAMGVAPEQAGESLRLSFGRFTTDQHIDTAAAEIGAAHARLTATRAPDSIAVAAR